MSYELHNEDCLLTMSRMPAEVVDLTVTSPPYDNLRKYKGYSFDFEKVARGLFRVTKKGGVVVWVVADATLNGSESGTSFRQALFFLSLGFNLHDTMIYAKKNFIPLTHNRYEQAWEYMFVFSKGKPKTFNGLTEPCITAGKAKNYAAAGSNVKEGGYRRRPDTVVTAGEKLRPNIFYYGLGGTKSKHPAPFPLQLAEEHILSWTNPKDTVYDPFSGSGSTIVASLKHNRRAIGSEIAEDYYYDSLERIMLL